MEYLKEHIDLIVTFFGGSGVVGLMSWLRSRSYKKGVEDTELSGIKTAIENLPCTERQEEIKELKVKLGTLSSIEKNLELIMRTLLPPKVFTQTESPISITPEGKVAAQEMEINKHIEANWENIIRYIDENSESMNAYDIQQLCIETASIGLDKFFLPSGVDQVKTHAFNSGLSFSVYGYLIGVKVRDLYFVEKKIDVGDIDKMILGKII